MFSEKRNVPGGESKTYRQFPIRLPEDLRERVVKSASANERSINAEIVHALSAVYPPIIDDSVNGALVAAAEGIATAWGDMLQAIGQDPAKNERYQIASAALANAKKALEG